MGEARRKRLNGEANLWYHGTDEFFEFWKQPPVASRFKPELEPHTFISLTKDRVLAEGAGELEGGLCSAALSSGAAVIDLRIDSCESRKCWASIIQTEIGKCYPEIQTFKGWLDACKSGEILRPRTKDSSLALLVELARRPGVPAQQRVDAFLKVQRHTRDWIELVIATGERTSLGCQAVICAEVDRYRQSGKKACTNLYVFDAAALEKPTWIFRPREEDAARKLRELKGY